MARAGAPPSPVAVLPGRVPGTVAGRIGWSSMSAAESQRRRVGPALEAMNVFLRWLIPTVQKFPRSQKFLLGDRIQSCAIDVLERLIEATYDRNRDTALRRANLEIEKLRHFMRLAFDLRHIDERRYEYAARELDAIGRCIGAWRNMNAAHATTP